MFVEIRILYDDTDVVAYYETMFRNFAKHFAT